MLRRALSTDAFSSAAQEKGRKVKPGARAPSSLSILLLPDLLEQLKRTNWVLNIKSRSQLFLCQKLHFEDGMNFLIQGQQIYASIHLQNVNHQGTLCKFKTFFRRDRENGYQFLTYVYFLSPSDLNTQLPIYLSSFGLALMKQMKLLFVGGKQNISLFKVQRVRDQQKGFSLAFRIPEMRGSCNIKAL
ncbi:PREDICTED: PRUPE_7G261200 [Prunus dulcis]|uniref:PREDICTED: PRUPE_7G261200 n=1 Tax=Prunus dulcis TaxID=3755 RepID=A0A5E4F2Q0_PRUDU|nr:PREDICTED: PRUPE_7G261200 [Prunus dulcis]